MREKTREVNYSLLDKVWMDVWVMGVDLYTSRCFGTVCCGQYAAIRTRSAHQDILTQTKLHTHTHTPISVRKEIN